MWVTCYLVTLGSILGFSIMIGSLVMGGIVFKLANTSKVLHSAVGEAFTEHGVIGKIFVAKKIFVNPSGFKLHECTMGDEGS